MKSREFIEHSVNELLDVYDSREAQNIIYTLLLDSYGFSRTDLLLDSDISIDHDAFKTHLERLKNHEPVQYITGIAHFYGREFKVNKDVLIPRPETEELVDWIIQEQETKSPVIWDVGAGSGCIAVTLAAEIPDSQVYSIDVSQVALRVVEENARRVGARTEVIHVDILKEIPSLPMPDILVSNPPYIPFGDRQEMSKNVLDYEPEVALFVSNEDPLIFYRRIAEIGIKGLKAGGELYFEIHESAGHAVSELMESAGYTEVELRKDLQGKSRMVRGRISRDET